MRNATIEDRWQQLLFRNADGAPIVPARFVLESGPGVLLVDVRDAAAAAGPLGYIRGSAFVGGADLDALVANADREPIVLIDELGVGAAALARRLEAAGGTRVAAMAGGLANWRALGFLTTRDPSGIAVGSPGPRAALDGTMTAENLEAYLSRPRSLHWVQLAALHFHASQSCVDGRDSRGVVGTPGGDTGEFALLLAAVEKLKGVELTPEQVKTTMQAHLDTFGDFYLHTDLHALEHLHGQLRADPATSGTAPEVGDASAWSAYLAHPPEDARASLLGYLIEPANIGCGHLKLSILHGAAYGVRPALVQSVLRAFFELLWAGSPELRPVILEGGHAEQAVVNVRINEEVWPLAPVPVAAPTSGDSQVFVNHPDVATFARHAYADFHTQYGGPLPVEAGDRDALCDLIDELANQQLGVTLSHLAKGLPLLEVRADQSGSVEVSQIG